MNPYCKSFPLPFTNLEQPAFTNVGPSNLTFWPPLSPLELGHKSAVVLGGLSWDLWNLPRFSREARSGLVASEAGSEASAAAGRQTDTWFLALVAVVQNRFP